MINCIVHNTISSVNDIVHDTIHTHAGADIVGGDPGAGAPGKKKLKKNSLSIFKSKFSGRPSKKKKKSISTLNNQQNGRFLTQQSDSHQGKEKNLQRRRMTNSVSNLSFSLCSLRFLSLFFPFFFPELTG
jgi:hypothetical protein